MTNFDYVEFVHRYYDSGRVKLGGLDYIVEYLAEQGKNVLVVESPLYPKVHNEFNVSLVSSHGKTQLLTLKMQIHNELFSWIFGVLIDFYVVLRYRAFGKIFLTSDPLTSLPAVVLRFLKIANFHYYHCTDFSRKRFTHTPLNFIYHKLLRLSVARADLVGSVSSRIYQELLPYKYKQLIYIPNSPSFSKYEKYRNTVEQRNTNMLVMTCLGISHRYKVLETIQLFNSLWLQNQKLQLTIIGSRDVDVEYNQRVQNLINSLECQHNITFTGYIKRDENCRIIGQSYIGLSFYDEIDSFSRYADSLKIREYAAMGIPCVSDLVTSTAEEMNIHGAGIAVIDINQAKVAIEQLLSDKNLYQKLSDNALCWAKELDKDKILEHISKKYFDPYLDTSLDAN